MHSSWIGSHLYRCQENSSRDLNCAVEALDLPIRLDNCNVKRPCEVHSCFRTKLYAVSHPYLLELGLQPSAGAPSGFVAH